MNSSPSFPIERPALLRLRLRALFGVGARADTICELLAREGAWTRISELADEGYSKRAIALILSDLASAGFVKSLTQSNALHYKLSRPEHLNEWAGSRDLAFPPWLKIMRFVRRALALGELAEKSKGVRRVEATKYRMQMKRLAGQLWLDDPPTTRGNPNAFDEMVSWAASRLDELARGESPALGVLKVRAAAVEEGGEAWVWLHRTAPDHDRLAKNLQAPHELAGGISLGTVVPEHGGWTAYQLIFEPRLDETALRHKTHHLVSPMTIAWRRIGSTDERITEEFEPSNMA